LGEFWWRVKAPPIANSARAAIDSRVVREGDLFFALRGEREDGHDFVAQAIEMGAFGAVVERPVDVPVRRLSFT